MKTACHKRSQTVFVGLSGGVDSAVSAYLLKKEGYRVLGAFIKVWEPDFLPCTSGEDRLSAMRVAAHLGIPFVSYDLAEEYKKGVVDYFIEEYKAGRTPNPDVMCNREIKFGAFWEKAQADGANMIATGHYARNSDLVGHYSGRKGFGALLRGADEAKDQSYFLWMLTQNDLAHSLFPIGGLQKTDVRKIAKEIGLPNAEKKDSQGLCFLGHVDMKEFLQRYLPVTRGPIYGTDGERLGEHDGAWFYTIGEHIPLALGEKRYVVSKDMAQNKLTVASEMFDVGRRTFQLGRTNWIREAPEEKKQYEVQIRYHGERNTARIEGASVFFDKPVTAADGQSLVVYDPNSNECLGGGIIG